MLISLSAARTVRGAPLDITAAMPSLPAPTRLRAAPIRRARHPGCQGFCHVAHPALSMSPAVDRIRILEYRLDRPPRAILEPLEEAAMPACMTRDSTGLFDDE